MYLRMHVLIKYFSRRNHRHESTPRTRILWGSVRISIPTLIIDYIYQWTSTCAWTCSLYMSSVMLMETLLSPCIRIRTCPQREQNNFMTEFSSQVSLSSKMIWLTFFIVTCRSKRVLAKNVSPIAWSYSPTAHLHLAHNVFMGSGTRAPVPTYMWTGLIYRSFVSMDIADFAKTQGIQSDRYWETEDQSGPPYHSSKPTLLYIAPRWRQEDGWIHSQTQESSDGFKETGVRERAEWCVPGARMWPSDSWNWPVDQGFGNAAVSSEECDEFGMFDSYLREAENLDITSCNLGILQCEYFW